MENEDVILHQMEETRTSLSEKLETLERKLVNTVEDTTDAVQETVATAKETVHEGVDAVHETMATVKETMQESIESIKECVDLKAQMQQHPWAILGGSVFAGYLLGSLVSNKSTPNFLGMQQQPDRGTFAGANWGNIPQPPKEAPPPPSALSGWLSSFGPELDKLKGLAVGAALGTVREMITGHVPPTMAGHLKTIIDDMTKKIGGDPLPSSDFAFTQNSPANEGSTRTSTQPHEHPPWNVVKEKTKKLWRNITDDDLQRAKGDFDQLVDIIQKRTGQPRDQVERALDNGVHI